MHARPLLVAAVALVLVSGDLASSSWSATGQGTSGAAAATLAPPGTVTSSRVPTGVALSWAASASPWTTGYQVLRSTSATGPFTALTSVGSGTGSYTDTTARAGSWYYAVAAVAGTWTASAVVASTDPVYYLRGTTTFADAACVASGTTLDLLQGHVAPAGAGTQAAMTTFTFCTDQFTTGQTLPAGTTTVNVWVSNGSTNRNCTFDLALYKGATLLGSGSGTVAMNTGTHALSAGFTTATTAFTTGERLQLRMTPRGNGGTNNCNSTMLYGDGSLAPSNVTLPG